MAPINWTPQDELVIARSECHWKDDGFYDSVKNLLSVEVTEKQLRKKVKEVKYKTYKNLVYTLSGELWGPEGKEKKDEKERMLIRNREEKILAFSNASDALLQEYKSVNYNLVAENKRLLAERKRLAAGKKRLAAGKKRLAAGKKRLAAENKRLLAENSDFRIKLVSRDDEMDELTKSVNDEMDELTKSVNEKFQKSKKDQERSSTEKRWRRTGVILKISLYVFFL